MTAQRPFTFRTKTEALSQASPAILYRVISDLKAHLVWSGERASDDKFKLLSLESTDERAVVGTTFTSTGANFNGTFHDRSVVTVAEPPARLVIDTDARLERKRGKPWEVHFEHRYDILPEGTGSRIVYTETISRVNYIPYWLQWWMRPLSKVIINSGDRKQLRNLARLAEERTER
jgi:hypothetical protein